MSRVSDEQFAAEANAGGVSRRVGDRSRGPKSGYYVSTPRFEEKHEGSPVTPEHARTHRRHLLDAGKESSFQGGWSHNNTAYLDNSVRFHSRALAMTMGAHWQQRAIHDANKGEDIPIGRVENGKYHVIADFPTRVNVKH